MVYLLQEKLNHVGRFIDTCKGVVLITDAQGRVVYANKSVESHTGYSVAQVVGKKPGELWGGHMSFSFYESMWDILAHQKKPFFGQVENRTRNGEKFQGNLSIAPLLNNQEEVQYFMHITPARSSPVYFSSFKSEFFSLFTSPQIENFIMAQMFFTWLTTSKKESDKITSVLKDFRDVSYRFTDLIYKVLIQSERKKFSERADDAFLINNAKSDPAAFQSLYNKYKEIIFHYFLRRTENSEIAEDLTQETFIQGFTHIQKFIIENATYQSYLFRIAHNVLVSFYRKGRPEVHIDENENFEVTYRDYTEERLSREDVWICIKKYLSVQEIEILSLYYKEGQSIKEISKRVKKTENAVKLSLSRSRKKLREPLGKEGVL